MWWGYDYDARNRELKPIKGVAGHEIIDESVLRSLCETFIFSRYDSTRLREADINNADLLESMFRARYSELDKIQRQLESSVGYKTKIQLWEMQLKGSGIIPPSDEYSSFADHFKRHSFLVIVSRMLCAYLSEEKISDDVMLDSASDGFQSWVFDAENGLQMLNRLTQDLRQYSWRTTTRDVLKSLYHGLIPKEKRKEFGEYYTPDDLAVTVVNEVLDDAWCDVQIKRAWKIIEGQQDDRIGFGVLDPSCGSGTFLFHAAKRLCNRIASHHRKLKSRSAEIVASLIFGIDIHPIAVEMSQATLLMALPYSDKPLQLNIALGDALQTEAQLVDMFNRDGLTVMTPKGAQIMLSQAIFKTP